MLRLSHAGVLLLQHDHAGVAVLRRDHAGVLGEFCAIPDTLTTWWGNFVQFPTLLVRQTNFVQFQGPHISGMAGKCHTGCRT